MEIRIDGLDQLLAKLDKMDADEALLKATQQATQAVQNSAKDLAPVDTGLLRETITRQTEKKRKKIVGTVGSYLEYAPYVEFGTGLRGESSEHPPGKRLRFKLVKDKKPYQGQFAQPFLYPALLDNRKNIENIYKRNVQEMIRSRR